MDQFFRIKSARDNGLRARGARLRRALLPLACAAASGCAEGPVGQASVGVRTMPLSSGGCLNQPPLDGLPDAVTRLFIEVTGDDGHRTLLPPLTRGEDDLGLREMLLEEIPVAEHARLQLFACTATGLGWMGTSPPIAIGENEKVGATVVLRPVERLSCAGSGLDSEHDAFAQLSRARAFPAVANLPDGRVFIGGGASKVTATGASAGGLLLAEQHEADYNGFDPLTALFSPHLTWAWEDSGRRLREPRIGAGAFAVGSPEAPAVLLVGGRSEVSWSAGAFGPLGLPSWQSPYTTVAPAPAFVERLDATTETSVPVVPGTGQGLVPRFMPAMAQDPVTGTVVVAGGLEYGVGPTPSVWVDIIEGKTLRSFPLAQARIGATLTPLGNRKFLLWGGDVTDCGAAPAVLIDAALEAPVRPLTVEAPVPPSSCQPAAGGRTWWVTAWHAATYLGTTAEGVANVLVTGGMEVLENKVEQTPDIGSPGSPPNVLHLTLPADFSRVVVRPVEVSADVAPLLRRAMHTSLVVRDRVVLGGGWSAGLDGTVDLNARKELVTIGLEYGSQAPTTFTAGPALELSEARLGPAMVGTADGTILFAGGIRRENGQFVVSRTAELFVPAPTANPCLGTGLPGGFDAGPFAFPELRPLGDAAVGTPPLDAGGPDQGL